MKKVEVQVNVECKTIFEGLGIPTDSNVEKEMNTKTGEIIKGIIGDMSNPESKVTRLDTAKKIAESFSQEELVLITMTYFEDVAQSVYQESLQNFLMQGMSGDDTEEAVEVTE